MAIATVVLFGTAAMFLYPALYPLMGFNERQFGVFAGATIHEVAQVVAAGRAVSPAAADVAVVTKMMRVILLAPALLIVGYLRRNRSVQPGAAEEHRKQQGIPVPWFVIGFIAVVVLQSIVQIPPTVRGGLLSVDTVLLGSAMFALGLGTKWDHFKKAGSRPLMLGAVLFAVLMSGGLFLARLLVAA